MNQSGHCKVWCNILKSQNVYCFILWSKFIHQVKGKERRKFSQASERERVKETDLLSSVTSEVVVVGVIHLFNEDECFPIE